MKRLHNQFTITTNLLTRRCSVKKSSEILSKISRKKIIFSKAGCSKNKFIDIFSRVFAKSLSNLVHDFWEDCFYKPKLLLAANRQIYLIISIYMSKIQKYQKFYV